MTALIRIAFQHFKFIAISVAAFSVPVSAAYTDQSVEGWAITQDGRSCNMAAEFESGTTFIFDYTWFEETLAFYIINENWTSLKNKEGIGVDVEINFEGDVEYDQFWNRPATVVAVPADEETAAFISVMANWDKDYSKKFLTSLAFSSGFSLIIDKKQIGGFRTDGTLKAVKELYKCAADGRSNSGQDPFAG